MKKILALILTSASLHANDVIFMDNGATRTGQLLGLDENSIRIQIPLPPLPGSRPDAPVLLASVTLPRSDVSEIEFSPNPKRDDLLRTATPERLTDVEAEWTRLSHWLAMPRAPAAQTGIVLGDLLLRTGDHAHATRALELFTKIETSAWSEDDRMLARQGRLRAMVASGKAQDAVAEARELATATENPAVLIEANYILAEADDKALRQLVEDNPRWQEDDFVRPEHARLYHRTLDLYLFPCLFHGSEIEPSARGLWGALRIHDFVGDQYRALECARDIITIYPGTKYASLSTAFIAGLPEDVRTHDPERTAREENAMPPTGKSPDKQAHEKTSEK